MNAHVYKKNAYNFVHRKTSDMTQLSIKGGVFTPCKKSIYNTKTQHQMIGRHLKNILLHKIKVRCKNFIFMCQKQSTLIWGDKIQNA